jgi:cystathionine beta-lyase
MAKKKPPSSTSLIAHPYRPPAGFGSVQPAVHKASTVLFADTAALRARTWQSKTGYTYGLHGTPTTFILEERIATLEGGLQTLLTPSGLAAITLVDAALLRSGDEVLLPTTRTGRPRSWPVTSSRAGASRTASTTRWTPPRFPRRCRRRRVSSGSRRRAR